MKQTAVRSILLLPLLCPIATTHATALTFLSKAVLSVALILQSGSATKVLGNNPADSLETQNEYLYMALAQPSCTSQPPFNPQDATSPSYNLTPNQPQFIRLYNETKHLKWMFTVNANLYDIEASKSWYMTTKYDDGKQVCDACGTLSTDKINGSQANPSIKWMQAMKGYRIKKIKIDPTRDWIAILFAKTGKKPMTIALCSNGELQFRQYGNHLHALPTMKRLQTADSFYYFDPYDV